MSDFDTILESCWVLTPAKVSGILHPGVSKSELGGDTKAEIHQ